MKKLLSLVLALLAPVALAAGFEGKVTMKMTGPEKAPPAMTFSIKDGFTRIDMVAGANGHSAAVIMDGAKREMTILIVDQHMYMTQPLPDLAAVAAKSNDGKQPDIEATTTKEKILGYDCVKYVSQTKEGTAEIWVTDQLGPFMGFGGGGAPGGGRRGPGGSSVPSQSWESALAGKNLFPLRVVTNSGGAEKFRLEATNIEKTSLPDSLFSAPADFKNLSDMMRGMGLPGGIPGMPGTK